MDCKTSEWRPGPTVCRCCLSEGCYKDISTEYFWMGKREVYAEMLSDTFNVSIAYSQSGGPNSNSRLICESCISRLRDASEFKRQVQECEKTFTQHLDPGTTIVLEVETMPTGETDKSVKLERIKVERQYSDDEFGDDAHDFPGPDDNDDDDDLDDQPLTHFASKVPKKESIDIQDLLDNSQLTVKRKSVKAKSTPTKKVKVMKKETPVKATASGTTKAVAKSADKKKKGNDDEATENSGVKIIWKRKKLMIIEDKANAVIILKNSNAVVFRYQRGKFMCAYCPRTCTNVAEVRTHSTIHNKLDIFENPEVRNSFPLRVDVTDLSCAICNESVQTIDILKLHLRDKHSVMVNPKYTDGVIPFILTEKDYKCVHCGILYEGFMSLFIHMNRHYQSFVCHTCGKGYSAKHKLRAHRMRHESGQFPCSRCDQIFSNRPAKNRHVAVVHARKEKYRCPVCDEYFDSYHSRLRHLDRVHDQKAEYKCALCPSVFGTANLRYSHMNVVHLKKKKFDKTN